MQQGWSVFEFEASLCRHSGGSPKETARGAVGQERKTRQGAEGRERTTRSDEERTAVSHEAARLLDAAASTYIAT